MITARLLTVIPALLVVTAAPDRKLEPVRVTATVEPAIPPLGLTELNVGAGGLTVNGWVPLDPPAVVTVTLATPNEAPAAIEKVAVICVALTTATLLTVIPALSVVTAAPVTKPEPVRVTETAVPLIPPAGLIELSVATGALTVNDCAPLDPPEVVTVTLAAPKVAPDAIENVAVI